MNFDHDEESKAWIERVRRFIAEEIEPAEQLYEQQLAENGRWNGVPPVLEELKSKARAQGLWNMFMPPSDGASHVDDSFAFDSPGLSNVTYAAIAELTGRASMAAEVFNCSPPDSGNMEVLHRYGTLAQKERWLRPLMDGEIRSAFLMTEPAVASSDATNVACSIARDGDHYVINGRKWWSSGANDKRCKFFILLGRQVDADVPPHAQHSLVLVPADTPGVRVVRNLSLFGYDDAPRGHGEVVLENVRVPVDNMILGEGRGFEVAQGRLGPGRIHHCMRAIGAAEIALEKMCARLQSRRAFGKLISEHSVWEERIAQARTNIEMSRLLCLKAAYMMDTVGNKAAKAEIAMIKVSAPAIALKVIDDAIQAHGGAGVSDDPGLARLYAYTRILRIVDGPDEVHNRTIARLELRKYPRSLGTVKGDG